MSFRAPDAAPLPNSSGDGSRLQKVLRVGIEEQKKGAKRGAMQAYEEGMLPSGEEDAAAIVVSKLAYTGKPWSACDVIYNWCKVFGCSDTLLESVARNLGIEVANPNPYGGWKKAMAKWCKAHSMKQEWGGEAVAFYRPDKNLEPALFLENRLVDGEIIQIFYKGPRGEERPVVAYSHTENPFWFFYGNQVPIGRLDDSTSEPEMQFHHDGKLYKFAEDEDGDFYRIWGWDTVKRKIDVFTYDPWTNDRVTAWTYRGDAVPKEPPIFPASPNPDIRGIWKDIMLGIYKPPSPPSYPDFLPSEF